MLAEDPDIDLRELIEQKATLEFRALRETLPKVTADWLWFAWSLRAGLNNGWIRIVSPVLTLDALARHVWVRGIEEAFAATIGLHKAPYEVSRSVVASVSAADALHRDHVVTFPCNELSRNVLATVHRMHAAIREQGDQFGALTPFDGALRVHGMELERGSWFSEILLGIGRASHLLDMEAVHELRQEGVATSLRRWFTEDLNRIAFVAATGGNVQTILDECRYNFGRIVATADRRLQMTKSKTLRQRFTQASIWGASGLLSRSPRNDGRRWVT